MTLFLIFLLVLPALYNSLPTGFHHNLAANTEKIIIIMYEQGCRMNEMRGRVINHGCGAAGQTTAALKNGQMFIYSPELIFASVLALFLLSPTRGWEGG